VTDPTLASEGMSTLYCLAPVSHEHENLDWEAARPRYRRRLLDQMAKIGLGDVESRIRFEHVMTPTTWREDLNIYRGATFNLAHTFGQMLHNRPRNRFEELDGVYLVGGVVQAFAPYLTRFGFAEAFRDKGRFAGFMGNFAVTVVEDDYAALTGCAAHLVALSPR